MDNTRDGFVGTMVVEQPEARYNVQGDCEETNDGYANFWFTLVTDGQPYYGTIYEADDGNVYMEGTQDQTGAKFILQRQD